MLIPKVASAAVIGKSGSVIKRMSEQSSCRYQLGEENDPFNTNERIVTITGSASQNVVMVSFFFLFSFYHHNDSYFHVKYLYRERYLS